MINFYDIVEKYNNDTNEIISYTANHDPNLLSHIMTLEDRDTSRLTPPRFDTNHIYAVRCWSRLHGPDPRCPMPKVVWSARSEPFTIAEPMDPLGLKPHAMQLPDIPKLIRALPRIPKAKALPFAAVSIPKDSNVSVTDDAKDTMRQWGAAWICTYGIPVFTICAWVAFSVILSILLMIPGFAWMLFLKFCVPVPVPAKAT